LLSVIMAGGVGERFWPLSRRKRPKQLLDLVGRGSMIGLTAERLRGLSAPEETFVITNVDQRDAVIASLDGAVPDENIIGEPVGRNTAPCIGLAARLIMDRFGDEPILVLPADHLVEPVELFQELVRAGAQWVTQHSSLLTFGIEPTRPETGYGYIRATEKVGGEGGAEIYRAAAFLEKPSADKAAGFLAEGGYYWNSGMFMWRAGTILDEIAAHMPDLAGLLDRIGAQAGTRPLAEVLNGMYADAPSISIDYGVMEKAADVVVLRARFDWNDVGSWEFIRDVHPADENGNVTVGNHVLVDAGNNTIVSPDRLVAILGVDDITVVDGGDTILVCRRDRVQEVKTIVQLLKKQGRDDLV
jgi:mannose-1-phosphate guanylyltransferase